MNVGFLLAKTGYSVFSFGELGHFIEHSDLQNLTNKIHYAIKKKYLYPVRRGFYSLEKTYNDFELANKILKPSYISLQSALRYHGMVFQHEEAVTLISYKTQRIEVADKLYSYRFMKDTIRNSQEGIIHTKAFSIASPERAMLDILYLNKQYYFDNLSMIDWGKAQEFVSIYQSKRLTKYFTSLRQQYDKSESIQ